MEQGASQDKEMPDGMKIFLFRAYRIEDDPCGVDDTATDE